ncbi:Rrf2 family transcriptional regulator [Psychrobacter lutiphocae]|uniref:Rrf2 family transcriptional regulator n=1 Tax=Psychrobacter lutiphocae TaxID=540500 RepID=UPI00037325C3|nr:Rrf2 family transcriptional regulator [Psychrobacter lutiphocae]
MRLTNYSDYALRTLMYLAVRSEQETLATITEIANSYQISRSHLTKIIHQLAQLGYIESIRGKNGGVRLAKAPQDIVLGEVLRHTEPDFYLVPCFPAPSSTTTAKSSQTLDKPSSIHNQPNPATETISLNTHTGATRATPLESCSIAPVCQLKSVFAEATLAFLQVLDAYTLADIITNNGQLWQILKLANTKPSKY